MTWELLFSNNIIIDFSVSPPNTVPLLFSTCSLNALCQFKEVMHVSNLKLRNHISLSNVHNRFLSHVSKYLTILLCTKKKLQWHLWVNFPSLRRCSIKIFIFHLDYHGIKFWNVSWLELNHLLLENALACDLWLLVNFEKNHHLQNVSSIYSLH